VRDSTTGIFLGFLMYLTEGSCFSSPAAARTLIAGIHGCSLPDLAGSAAVVCAWHRRPLRMDVSRDIPPRWMVLQSRATTRAALAVALCAGVYRVRGVVSPLAALAIPLTTESGGFPDRERILSHFFGIW